MASLGIFPEEVMIEILSELPPESLLRFKCVNKSWHALINDPKFGTKHYSNSRRRKHVFLWCPPIDTEINNFSFLKLPLSLNSSVSFFDTDFPLNEDFRSVEILGHSHGLICLTRRRCDIYLWNPLTREFRKLPPSIILLTDPPDSDRCSSFTRAVGFGYDSKSMDFKVVRVVSFVKLKPEIYYSSRVEIYDLSKDRWREIKSPFLGNRFWTPSFKMCHEGTCYWWGLSEECTGTLETFDMSDEVFGQIPIPEDFDVMADRYKCLGVFNGSIVLFPYPYKGYDRMLFNVWEMEKDEYGGVSWSKILTIGSIFGIEKGWLIVNSDELFMEVNEGRLIFYNDTKSGRLKLPTSCFATLFEKSLISVKGGNNVTYEF
ncbi:F-box protein CPR1-like [Cucumis melo]|uniref:F-box protein CPR1-like n=1 Tax=Cucumis melo TaxID=3656 RepID=A0A1S3B974_CUCME|nr:F-box protein CPR1-like [Cucumis melo]